MCLASIVMTDVSQTALVDFATGPSELQKSQPPANRLLEGAPQQVTRNLFSDPSGQFLAGVWESTPGKWQVCYTEHEFCHITRGVVRLEDNAGHCWRFEAGQSFVIPAGFTGTWQTVETVTKVYAVFETAPK